MAEDLTNAQHEASNPPEAFISTLRDFEPPPKDFNPLQEKNSVLVKHGYPARPTLTTPLHLAAWEKVFSGNPTFIKPTFSPLPSVPRVLPKEVHLLDAISANTVLSGALLPVPAAGNETEYLYGSWTIPKAYPPKSAHIATGLKNGTWSFRIWIEIDGIYTKSIGTTQRVVVSGGKISAQTAYAWIGSSTGTTMSEAMLNNFPVGPGDVVTCAICQQDTGRADGGLIGIANRSETAFSSSQMFPTSNSPSISTVAKWMVELPPAASKEDTVQFGAVTLWDCAAGSGNIHKANLSDARLIYTERNSATVSNVDLKGDNVLVISSQI